MVVERRVRLKRGEVGRSREVLGSMGLKAYDFLQSTTYWSRSSCKRRSVEKTFSHGHRCKDRRRRDHSSEMSIKIKARAQEQEARAMERISLPLSVTNSTLPQKRCQS